MKPTRYITGSLTLLALPVFAHTGHGLAIDGAFWQGVLHPVTGLDHLAILLGIGFLAAQFKNKNSQLNLMAFALVSLVSGLAVGSIAGVFVGMETVILASIFVAAFALWQQKHGGTRVLAILSATMLVAHGWAHGVEAPVGELSAFCSGMLLGATGLMHIGMYLGARIPSNWLSPVLGTGAILLTLAG
ncbi:HupE/UreJ family protein [Parasalinivibrio latis]|uniref:HupE/UreJ family protein n=1 Tax=Parasalinivibrio latis TaxID=2952610 RepID=UPI0030E57A26